MRITFLSNIPSPYRIDFFNELGKFVNLKVIFEAEKNPSLNKKWYKKQYENFDCVFLKEGAIVEKRVNWKILKHLHKDSQDLLIVTNYSYYTELVALLYLKLKRIPYCLEIDGGIIKKESKLKNYFKRYLIKGAIAYISPSKATDKFLLNYGVPSEKIHRYSFTSLNEIDILTQQLNQFEKKKIRENLKIREEKVVISVGQFIYRKGYDVLLHAAKLINKEVGIYIIGGKVTNEYLKLKTDLNLDNVHFLDFIEKNELKEYYKAADLFVLPTREDIWGLVVNEAMAYGLPVITTDKCIAGIELIEDGVNGFIVPNENFSALAESITNCIYDDVKLSHFSKNNLNKIQQYTIETMVEQHLDIFNRILVEREM